MGEERQQNGICADIWTGRLTEKRTYDQNMTPGYMNPGVGWNGRGG